MKYNKGDLVRVKEDGKIKYFDSDYNGRAKLNPYDVLRFTNPLAEVKYKYDEIEPVHLRHEYYGKIVRVWNTDDPPGTKHKRILIDVRNNGVVAVYGDHKEYFRNGNVYKVNAWDFWEPIPEQSKPPNHLPTHEEMKAFEIVRGYLERLKD